MAAKTRAQYRETLTKLLALVARPGTPEEGQAAWEKAQAFAKRHGFRIDVRRPRSERARTRFRAWSGFCVWCGQGFVTAATGRPRMYCSGRCRVAAHRARQAV